MSGLEVLFVGLVSVVDGEEEESLIGDVEEDAVVSFLAS